MDFAMRQGWDNDSNHRLHRGSRKRGSDTDVSRKRSLYHWEAIPEYQVDGQEMRAERLSMRRSEIAGTKSGKDRPSTQTQDTMEVRRMTESGERLGRLWRKAIL